MLVMMLLIFTVACAGNSGAPASSTGNDSAPKKKTEKKVDFPKKEIKLVYHSKAGSGGDIFLRNLAKPLEKILGVPVIVENRTGASGANAWLAVKDAAPDGYTLIGTSSTIISGPIVTPMKVSYKDFKPLAQMFQEPQLLYVSSKSPFNSIKELIEYELKNPKKLNWTRSTPASGDTIALAMISEAAGIKPKQVSFEGGSEALVAILGGHVDVAIGEYSEIRGQFEAGKIKMLTILTDKRHPELKDLPTLKETGWNVVVKRPRGLMAPKDTPDEITQILTDALKQVLNDPEFQKVWKEEGLLEEFVPGDEFMKIYDEMDAFTRNLLK